ncbi:MAG: polyketide synthase dehydratase domain-containing protein, partial [Smithellaceae bacterium]
MEDVSRQNLNNHRFDFTLEIAAYWRDHYFEGQAVLPAVEILILAAAALRRHCPDARLQSMIDARFQRLLALDAGVDRRTVAFNIEEVEQGWSVALLSSLLMKGGVRRTLEHARVVFGGDEAVAPPTPVFQNIEKLSGDCLSVPAFAVYRSLVPFGAAYQNIVGDVSVSKEGALAYLSGGA